MSLSGFSRADVQAINDLEKEFKKYHDDQDDMGFSILARTEAIMMVLMPKIKKVMEERNRLLFLAQENEMLRSKASETSIHQCCNPDVDDRCSTYAEEKKI